MEKVQWNSIDKKQNGLKYLKNDIIHPPPQEIPSSIPGQDTDFGYFTFLSCLLLLLLL